jgi:hypothetical protein
MRWLALFIPVAAWLTHTAHLALDRDVTPGADAAASETFPSVPALRLMSLGQESLVADYYWLRALNHFGDSRMHPLGYPKLPALVERVLALDPWFRTGYIFAGTALTVKPFDPKIAVRLLEQGERYRPDDWRIPFLLGFTAYYSLSDYATAARAMSAASRFPEAPSHLGPLATRLAAEAGEPEIGLTLIDQVIEEVRDDKLREKYLQAKQLLLVELHLKWLRQATERYRAAEGRAPEQIEDLVKTGLMSAIPDAPAGGRYVLDANGAPVTAETIELLRLPEAAKGVP